MAYQLTCADTGADCPGPFPAATLEELMDHVKVHAQHAHPDMQPPPPEVVQQLIKEV